MDPYFKAVGFTNFENLKLDKLIDDIKINHDNKYVFELDGETFIEYYKMYTKNIGLIISAIINEKENIKIIDYQPYIIGDLDIEIEEYYIDNINGDYVVIFEHSISREKLTFKLQNASDYLQNTKILSIDDTYKDNIIKKANISGLSLDGTVILPIVKDEEYKEIQKIEEIYYKELTNRFKDGDIKAGELLNLYVLQSSEVIRERLKNEDFLSVIESYFLPIEDDKLMYSILGTIKKLEEIENNITKEKIYKMILDITGTDMQIYINKLDIIGIPQEGMRFMGTCKLYGKAIM